jgi:hypothetical protein
MTPSPGPAAGNGAGVPAGRECLKPFRTVRWSR